MAAARGAAPRDAGGALGRRDAVRQPLRGVPGRPARHDGLLERARVQGAGRGRAPGRPHPGRDGPAATHRSTAGDGDRVDSQGRARRRALHRGDRAATACAGSRSRDRRSRACVHRAAAQPRDHSPPRLSPRRRRHDRVVGQGADGERVPGDEPFAPRRGLRECVPGLRRLHRRQDRRTVGRVAGWTRRAPGRSAHAD